MKHKYVPYTGPAGPSRRRVANNNRTLFDELKRLKINCMIAPVSVDGDSPDPMIILTSCDGQIYTIGYDRYGFSSDRWSIGSFDDEDDIELLDQATWDDTTAWALSLS